jgi:hypothetical protein
MTSLRLVFGLVFRLGFGLGFGLTIISVFGLAGLPGLSTTGADGGGLLLLFSVRACSVVFLGTGCFLHPGKVSIMANIIVEIMNISRKLN